VFRFSVCVNTHLQAHVVGQEWEEVMLDVAADEGMAEGPVQRWVSGKVQDSVGHLVDPFGTASGGKHRQSDVLQKHGGQIMENFYYNIITIARPF